MANASNDDRARSFEEAVWQFLAARLRGAAPDVEELVRKYPEFEDRIRRKVDEFQKVDSLFDSLVQAEASDFDVAASAHDLTGQKVGTFEIIEIIGRGGMGVVYLARDTKLDRSVAIKSMPVELVGDSTARMRFQREAKLLASLNHPNIAVIHDIIEQDNDSGYLVLEYIPGQTLTERIAHKPLKLQEALSIGQQVAEAISAAHEKGVVHRDLKPGNIKITPEGRVKVLDFGLAKATVTEGSSEVTDTQPGHIIGTPAYMSPEQARGQPIDKRSDIWSFGCVLYEMLTGKVLFKGETVSDTLANILKTEPNFQPLPESTPANIRVLLRRCLEKEPHRRLRDMGDISITLEDTATELQHLTLRTETVETDRTQPTKAIVVLPFENLSSNQEQEYFVDGMTDALIAELGKIKALRVISRTSSMHFKGTDKKVPEIAKELGVDAIIEGSVLKVGNDVRITVQLIDGRIDTHLWSENYTGTLTDILALQSEVTLAITREIEVAVTPEEERRIKRTEPVNPKAHEAYLKGIFFFEKKTEESFRTAADYLNQAIEIEPNYVEAYAWLSAAYWIPSCYGYGAGHESFSRAKIAANTAIKLDETCGEAHSALGWIALMYDWDWQKAKLSLERAIDLNPNLSYGYFGFAWYWVVAGRFDKAIDMMQTAVTLDPHSQVLNNQLANMYRFSGHFERAVEQREKTLELAPGFVIALSDLAEDYLSMSMYPEAIASVEKAMSLAGRTPLLIAMLGRAYAISGRKDEAEILLQELKDKAKSEYVLPIYFAALYGDLGNADEAFRWLKKVYQERHFGMFSLRIPSSLKPLRLDPRFDDLLERMNFPE
ncbi:MAG TPA: protein kinase [Sedimentisphaerales bacterium]|nr:protein kinase [Sedimentisphaerales bacterium]